MYVWVSTSLGEWGGVQDARLVTGTGDILPEHRGICESFSVAPRPIGSCMLRGFRGTRPRSRLGGGRWGRP